jgi:predicted S18 family serine protease
MIKLPVLAVDKGKGVAVDLEIESRKGKGTLFLDVKLCPDKDTREAINNVFSLYVIKKQDILVRIKGNKHNCLCGGSLGLPVYLGMYACIRGLKLRSKTFATGCIDKKGKIIQVGGLAEKIKAILGKAEVLLVPKGQGLPIKGINVKEVLSLKDAIKMTLIK